MTKPPDTQLPDDKAAARIMDAVVRLTCLAFIFTYLISWRLYAPDARIFLPTPIVPTLLRLSAQADWLLFGLNLYFFLWVLISPASRIATLGAVVFTAVLMLQDINRLQPYDMMYGYTLLVALFCRGDRQAGLTALRIMVCGVYFWGGFHKLNLNFYGTVFPWFIEPLHVLGPPPNNFIDDIFIVGMLATPLFEALIGILLLFPARRKRATAMAFIMLVVVLACLGPFGHNWAMVVWPWNIWLFLVELYLFFHPTGLAAPFLLRPMRRHAFFSFLLFVVAPVTAMFTPWYTQPGFKLYSGNTPRGQVVFPMQETMARVPRYLRKAVTPMHTLDMNDWGIGAELQNAPYPVPQVFRTGAAGLCPYLDYPKEAFIIVFDAPPFYSLQTQWKSYPLCE